MGSLRNPIGPLPSSIYWRRRAVLLAVVALLALLIAWVVNLGGPGGDGGTDSAGGKHPTKSITPGPSGTGPAISQHPGGRDESTGSGGADGSGGDGSAGSGGGSDDSAGGDQSDGSGSGGSGAGTSSGDQVPAGSSLPDCTAGGVTLSVRSTHNSYAPGDEPKLILTAKNTSDKACKVDLGPKAAVLTITKAGGDQQFWSSDDCPSDPSSVLLRVPAGGSVTRTVTWDREPSAPQCATPKSGKASAGTYLVEAKAPQLAAVKTSFVLKAD
ncbi:hypothetical protein [Streptomyces beihaiensis]|uniref:DUF4232 domain-containing protein n=1 Tax=Streptomyces beihaiensis TaxID=2984495 RepID=A0ABT3TPJ6_9ACTN|nr:hypothetical protein [Streptomyces beihaiensis]MCX3058441.1 hypothetical protein [Streptomyces beihaiensis]